MTELSTLEGNATRPELLISPLEGEMSGSTEGDRRKHGRRLVQ
jgi:hypothetical protein